MYPAFRETPLVSYQCILMNIFISCRSTHLADQKLTSWRHAHSFSKKKVKFVSKLHYLMTECIFSDKVKYSCTWLNLTPKDFIYMYRRLPREILRRILVLKLTYLSSVYTF